MSATLDQVIEHDQIQFDVTKSGKRDARSFSSNFIRQNADPRPDFGSFSRMDSRFDRPCYIPSVLNEF